MTDRERFEAWVHGNGWATSRYSASAVKSGAYRNWHVEAAWQAWQARCPEGWSVVPITPTQYQQNAGSVERYHKQGNCEDIYKAMLAAAPHSGEES